MPDRQYRVLFGLVVLLGIMARIAVLWPNIGRNVDDPDHYVDLANTLRTTHQFAIRGKPTAYRPPLYPVLLAPLVPEVAKIPNPLLSPKRPMNWATATFHLLLGGGTIAFTMLAARRFGLSTRQTGLAGLIVALDPLLVFQTRAIMTETLAALLLAWALAAGSKHGRWGAIETGLSLGLAALCRPSTLAVSALIIACLLLTDASSWRRRIRHAGIVVATIVLLLCPWAIRNKWAVGEFVWTTTHGGYTLALANNPDYYRDVLHGPPGAVWDEKKQRSWALTIARATDGMTEPEADRWLARSGWRMATAQPGDFLGASLAREGRFWAIAPSSAVYTWHVRWASAAWNVPLFILAGLGLCRRSSWRWPRGGVPAQLLGLTAVHLFYWTDMRMRAPLVPALAIAAGMGLIAFKKSSK